MTEQITHYIRKITTINAYKNLENGAWVYQSALEAYGKSTGSEESTKELGDLLALQDVTRGCFPSQIKSIGIEERSMEINSETISADQVEPVESNELRDLVHHYLRKGIELGKN